MTTGRINQVANRSRNPRGAARESREALKLSSHERASQGTTSVQSHQGLAPFHSYRTHNATERRTPAAHPERDATAEDLNPPPCGISQRMPSAAGAHVTYSESRRGFTLRATQRVRILPRSLILAGPSKRAAQRTVSQDTLSMTAIPFRRDLPTIDLSYSITNRTD